METDCVVERGITSLRVLHEDAMLFSVLDPRLVEPMDTDPRLVELLEQAGTLVLSFCGPTALFQSSQATSRPHRQGEEP